MSSIDWSAYPDFTIDEFRCKHTGLCNISKDIVDLMQSIRTELGKPVHISSGYRHESHPTEAMKDQPGEHTRGWACDIICYSDKALKIFVMAHARGVRRFGMHQKGRASGRFLHIGIGDWFSSEFPSDAIWTY